MKNATMTKAGAKRVGHTYLAGRTVQYDGIHKLGLCVKNVYSGAKRIAGIVSFATREAYIESGFTLGDNSNDPGLILE